jgi:hypothetical protein
MARPKKNPQDKRQAFKIFLTPAEIATIEKIAFFRNEEPHEAIRKIILLYAGMAQEICTNIGARKVAFTLYQAFHNLLLCHETRNNESAAKGVNGQNGF